MKYLIFLLFLTPPAHANKLYKKLCSSCHGVKGEGVPFYAPRLSGQYAFYLENQIKDIRSGARANRMSKVMKPIFKGLKEKEITAISKWLEGQK